MPTGRVKCSRRLPYSSASRAADSRRGQLWGAGSPLGLERLNCSAEASRALLIRVGIHPRSLPLQGMVCATGGVHPRAGAQLENALAGWQRSDQKHN